MRVAFPLLALVAASLPIGSSAATEDRPFYIGRSWGEVEANFVALDDTLLVTERDREWRATDRFVASDRAQNLYPREDRFGQLPHAHFLLVDRFHLLLPRLGLGPTRYGLSPEVGHPTPLQVAVLGWVGGAGGIERQLFPATTSASADLSCALRADGSLASWRPGDAASFWSSPPHTFDHPRLHVMRVFCLRVDEREFVAIMAVGGAVPTAERTPCFIFEAHKDSSPTVLFLSDDSHSLLITNPTQAAADTVVGITKPDAEVRAAAERPGMSYDEAFNAADWIVARITFRDGAWKFDHARLTHWPREPADQRIVFVGKTELWVAARSNAEGVSRVQWPFDAATVAFTPQPLIEHLTPFQRDVAQTGGLMLSPSGRHLLWLQVRSDGDWIDMTIERGAGSLLGRFICDRGPRLGPSI